MSVVDQKRWLYYKEISLTKVVPSEYAKKYFQHLQYYLPPLALNV